MNSFKPSVQPQSHLNPEVIDAVSKTEDEIARFLSTSSAWFPEIMEHLGSAEARADVEEEDEAERLKRLQDESDLIELLRPRIWTSLVAAVDDYVKLRGLGSSGRG